MKDISGYEMCLPNLSVSKLGYPPPCAGVVHVHQRPLLCNLQLIPSGCSGMSCAGSIMMCPPPVKSRDQHRPKEEVLSQAKDFIDQYYTSIKRYQSRHKSLPGRPTRYLLEESVTVKNCMCLKLVITL